MNDFFSLGEAATPTVYDNTSKLTQSFDWLDTLNPEQKQAVTTTEGPVLVLSGAGTGKTKVLTTRLAYILSKNLANPWECLVVTFTNRAANEMKERARSMIGDIVDRVWLGTFHSVCVKILRNHAELVNLKSNFTILSEDDQKRVIKQIEEAEGIDDKKYPPQSVLDHIQRCKDKGLTVDKVGRNDIYTDLYKKYQNRLTELNCVDFSDIILHSLEILLKHADILDKYQQRFKYVLVDEYQDTNTTQYLFLRLLSQKSRNLCVVGDDDQSIYSWRGAEVENILKFEKDFADAKIIRLERNYRSTANILGAASHLISNNQGRLGKTLKVAENSPAQKCDNSKVKVISVYDGREEASYITEEIENLRRNGKEYSNMAILVRTAFQTREFEEKFISEAIPYQVIGGLKFYERAEIRDALAYFRVIVQQDDDLALERIINKPTRGIGAKALSTFQDIARQEHISLYMAIEKALSNGLVKGKAKTGMEELLNNFTNWRKELNAIKPNELASLVLEDSGYIEMLKNDKSPEAPGRIENLNELINVMSDEEKFPAFADFMEHVSLVMDNDDSMDKNKVMLITLHSAKGLEFDVVFLPGWEESLFPHQRAMDEGGLEEERRLAYVAITRAKQTLYITTAMNRRIYGQWQQNIPSRFINELPPQYIDLKNNCSGYFQQNISSPTKSNIPPLKRENSSKYQNANEDRYSYEPDYSEPNNLIGTKVLHQSFGYGVIRKVEGNKLGIFFFNNGFKMVMSNYVKVV